MVQTYEEHKAAVDAANLTPAIDWYFADPDHPHRIDDAVIAKANVPFGNEVVVLELHLHGTGASHSYEVREFTKDPNIYQSRIKIAEGQTWPLMKSSLATGWENHCERLRARLATEAYARDILSDDGISYPAAGPVRMSMLRLRSTQQSSIPTVPAFDPETLEYVVTTAIPRITFEAEVPTDAVVTWLVEGVETAGASLDVTLTNAETVITATVALPGHTPTTYVFTMAMIQE